MRSLLERAKPQLLQAMAKETANYPFMASELEKHLTQTYYVNHLLYMYVIQLEGIWYMGTGEWAVNAWEYFSPE